LCINFREIHSASAPSFLMQTFGVPFEIRGMLLEVWRWAFTVPGFPLSSIETRQGNMKATADVFDTLKFDLYMSSFGLACAGCGSTCWRLESLVVDTSDWFYVWEAEVVCEWMFSRCSPFKVRSFIKVSAAFVVWFFLLNTFHTYFPFIRSWGL
jgi:hypothetical protein